MMSRPGLWRALAALFTLVNLVGIGWAIAESEGPHAAIHVAFSLLGMYGLWRLSPRAGRADAPAAELAELRLEQLQQSVDAIALEVERSGEGQRVQTEIQPD